MKKVLAIIGSPRRGNSYQVTRQVEERMKQLGGVEFDYLFLMDADLQPCRGCFACLSKGEQFCPLLDDRESIVQRMLDSDGVILVSPVYVLNVTALMKNFIDRLAYICHRPLFFRQHAMVLSTTGGVGLRPVLKYLADISRVWMFRSAAQLGLVTPPRSLVSAKMQRRNDKKIEAAAQRFYNQLVSPKVGTPSLLGMIQFRIQRAVFTLDQTKEEMPADHEYYQRLHGKKFYVDAKINVFKDAIAWLVEKIYLFQALRTMRKN